MLAVAAAHRLGVVRTERWPMVAAYLLAAGAGGDAVVTLAGLPASASGWEVDPLVPRVLAEIDAPEVPLPDATEVLARVLAQAYAAAPGHAVLRALARLAPAHEYPEGRLTDAFAALDWLDAEYDVAAARREADEAEAALRALPPLDLPGALAAALVGPSPA